MESFKVLTFIISALLHAVLFLIMLLLSKEPEVRPEEPTKQWLVFDQSKNSPMMAEETKRVAKETRTKLTSPAAVNALQPENPQNSVLRPSLKDLQKQSTAEGSDKQLQEALRTSNDSQIFMNQIGRAHV